jgi:hypothetical protein
MRLLHRDNKTGKLTLTEEFVGDDPLPPYAILSHRWGGRKDEVTFDDLRSGIGLKKSGWKKIKFCEAQARADGICHFWIDSCCIDRTNSAELSTAIVSMFRWYKLSTRCYVFLSDVERSPLQGSQDQKRLNELAFRESKWFTRGWTLQELLAPSSIHFFAESGECFGCRVTLSHEIHNITGIPVAALQRHPLCQFGIEERFNWAKIRRTKLEEDQVYSLLGIFGVSMPVVYGEGRKKAMHRLQKEISTCARWHDGCTYQHCSYEETFIAPTPAPDLIACSCGRIYISKGVPAHCLCHKILELHLEAATRLGHTGFATKALFLAGSFLTAAFSRGKD